MRGGGTEVGFAADEDDGDLWAADGADFFYPLLGGGRGRVSKGLVILIDGLWAKVKVEEKRREEGRKVRKMESKR